MSSPMRRKWKRNTLLSQRIRLSASFSPNGRGLPIRRSYNFAANLIWTAWQKAKKWRSSTRRPRSCPWNWRIRKVSLSNYFKSIQKFKNKIHPREAWRLKANMTNFLINIQDLKRNQELKIPNRIKSRWLWILFLLRNILLQLKFPYSK